MKFTDSQLVEESSFQNYYLTVGNTSVIPADWIQQLMGIIDVLQLILKCCCLIKLSNFTVTRIKKKTVLNVAWVCQNQIIHIVSVQEQCPNLIMCYYVLWASCKQLICDI